MKILIVEDEKPAQERLKEILIAYDSEIQISAGTGSVRETVSWLKSHPAPDLILLDIQLSDGIALEIFKQCRIDCPVIFTTAFDKYILKAFEYNSIDYLMKPIKPQKLFKALDKYFRIKSHFVQNIPALVNDLMGQRQDYRQRITVRKGIDFVSVPAGEIAFFYTEFKLVFLITSSQEKYVVDQPLVELEQSLDPGQFFRLNRKYLAQINSIRKFKSGEKGKIMVELDPPAREIIHVSQERAAHFRKWMDR